MRRKLQSEVQGGARSSQSFASGGFSLADECLVWQPDPIGACREGFHANVRACCAHLLHARLRALDGTGQLAGH